MWAAGSPDGPDKRAADTPPMSARARSTERPLVVAHVLGRLSPGGGVQVVVRRLALGVDPDDVELHVMTMRPAWDDLTDVPAHIHTGTFDGGRYRLRDRFSIMARFAVQVRRLRPDVVQLHSGMAWLGLLARVVVSRTAFVLEVHDAPGSGRHSPSTDRVEAALVRWTRATAVCHSTQVEQALLDVAALPRRSVVRFPLGIDTDEVRPVDPATRRRWRQEHGIADDVIVAVAVGRSAALKRFDLIVMAVAEARTHDLPVELVLIGPGDNERLAAVATAHGISEAVHLLGFVDDLGAAIASCDILCSASEYEGFGLTIAEGMACGLPVVATVSGGVPDVVADGSTGHLVAVGDLPAFAARLRDLAIDASARSAFGAAGRVRAEERFSIDAMVASFADLYGSVASGRRQGTP